MPKKIFIIIIALIIVGGVGYWFFQSKTPVVNKEVFDPKNTSYMIEGNSITLINGKAQKEIATGSAEKIEVSAWGEPMTGVLDSDDARDAALMLTYSVGGSGKFYYIAAALQDPQTKKALGANAIFLGDRIASQNISIADRKITVNYADRKLGEPMTTPPSVGFSRTFEIQGAVLVEITAESAKRERSCVLSGGTIKTSLCCQSAADFPDNCLIGACGCAPAGSHEVKTCDCGTNKCFDGQGCKPIK